MLSKCKILTVESIHWHSKEHKPILLVALLQSSWNMQEQWWILSIPSFKARRTFEDRQEGNTQAYWEIQWNQSVAFPILTDAVREEEEVK